jgi:hypothetical protein
MIAMMQQVVLACGGAGIAILALGGCGDERAQSQPIVTVGATVIRSADYGKAYERAIAQFVVGRGYTRRHRYYDPPNFKWCVKDRRAYAVGANKNLSVADTRDRCARHIAGRRELVLQGMIMATWIVQEARRLGVNAPDHPSPIMQRELYDRMISRALRDDDFQPSEHAITSYYQAHAKDSWRPESRDALAIVTDTNKAATNAKRLWETGVPWHTVARRYDFQRRGESLTNITQEHRTRLSAALFATPPGQIASPVAAEEGFYVAKVTRVTPAHRIPLTRLHEGIRKRIAETNWYKASLRYVNGFRHRARAKTTCVPQHRVPYCRNGSRQVFEAMGATGGWVPSQPSPTTAT